MAGGNGSAPFLISGGGIGGLIAAYALAHKGFPVRLFEQSSEFKEVGAGIQLGPNIFRVLEKIGLKDAVLADAHVPPAQEMRELKTSWRKIRSASRAPRRPLRMFMKPEEINAMSAVSARRRAVVEEAKLCLMESMEIKFMLVSLKKR